MEKKYVIIRADKAGVFFGTLESKNGSEVELSNCRKLYYWDGAATVQQLALDGVSKPENCKFTVIVPNITILGVIEIIPCSEKSIISLNSVPVWKR
jgi:hypothetical protein